MRYTEAYTTQDKGGDQQYEICEELKQDEKLKNMLTPQITRTCYPDPELKTFTIDFCFFISSACAEYTRSLSWNTIKRHFPELNATVSKIPWSVMMR